MAQEATENFESGDRILAPKCVPLHGLLLTGTNKQICL